MSQPTPLCLDWQATLLETLRARGQLKVAALAADVAHLAGVSVDDTAVLRWVTGARGASLGLLPILLHHCGAAKVLGLIAREYGLRVVEECPREPESRDLQGEALDVVSSAAHVAEAVRVAMRDGRVDQDEAQAILRSVEEARLQLLDVERLVAPTARRSGR